MSKKYAGTLFFTSIYHMFQPLWYQKIMSLIWCALLYTLWTKYMVLGIDHKKPKEVYMTSFEKIEKYSDYLQDARTWGEKKIP